MKPIDIQPCRYPQRNRYFYGKLLSVDDFQTEQTYFRDKQRLHNRLLHGFGVVTGLAVSIAQAATGESVIRVGPGLALDCYGNEIMVCEEMESREVAGEGTRYLCIQYHEVATDVVPNAGSENESVEHSRIEERSVLTLATSNPARNHRRRRTCWRACGQDHAIPLARLKRTSGYWRVERRFHRPTVA